MKHYKQSGSYSVFVDCVYAVVAKIPRGKTMTYGEVARRAGYPGAARAVGNALNKNPDTKTVPCHRVVRANGVPGDYARGPAKKLAILRREGAIGPVGKARMVL